MFNVGGANGDGFIARFNNSTTSGVNNSSGILRLSYSEITPTQLAGTSSSVGGGAYWVKMSTSTRGVGRIQSWHKDRAPKAVVWRVDSGCVATDAGPFNRRRTGDIAFISGGCDFGEFFVCGDFEEWPEMEATEENTLMNLPEGLIVYVREGKFWREGPGLPMAVTQNRRLIWLVQSLH